MSGSTKAVTVIGATGKLAVPVVHRWVTQGVAVRAVVRDVDKARALLPSEVTLTQGDLRDVESLRRSLEDTRYLYLNLSTDTLDPSRDFYTEHQGVANVLEASKSVGVEQIVQLSGLGAHPANADLPGPPFFPNVVRMRGHALVRASGIPFTLLHATWFFDSLRMFVRDGVFTTIGRFPGPFYFTNSYDLADQALSAFGNSVAHDRDFALQGPDAIRLEDAAARFVALVAPGMRVRQVPLAVATAMSWVVPELRMPVALTRYLRRFPDHLLAEETWEVLGRPTFTLESFFRTGLPATPTSAAIPPAAA